MLATRLLRGHVGAPRPLYPPTDDGWTRSANNPILVAAAAWEGGGSGWVQEPSVLYEGGVFRMWYTGGQGPNYRMGYASCSGDPTVPANWTKYGSNPILGGGGSGYAGVASRNCVFRIAGTLHVYFGNGTDLLHSTSTDGLSWATPTTVFTTTDVGGSATQLTNSAVWQEGPSDWRMLIEVVGGSWVDRIGYATSSDGLDWTIGNGGTYVSSLCQPQPNGGSMGPFLIREGATYHLWYHGNRDFSGWPEDCFHATSSDALDWTITGPVLQAQGSGTFEYDQAVDPCPVVAGDTAYLFYTGANNTSDHHGYASLEPPWFAIGVASAPAVP